MVGQMRPGCLTRSWSGSGAAWPVTVGGNWKRPVSLVAMHHCRNGRMALR